MIDSLTDHHIICGFGRVGRQVARDLRAARAKYVVVDSRAENRELAEEVGVRFVEGDATNDAVLIQAGIERARSIIACADSDPENIFITLTARELRADIAIVARAALEDSEKKLKRAGVDRVSRPTRRAAPRWHGWLCTRSYAAWSTSIPTTVWKRSSSGRTA